MNVIPVFNENDAILSAMPLLVSAILLQWLIQSPGRVCTSECLLVNTRAGCATEQMLMQCFCTFTRRRRAAGHKRRGASATMTAWQRCWRCVAVGQGRRTDAPVQLQDACMLLQSSAPHLNMLALTVQCRAAVQIRPLFCSPSTGAAECGPADAVHGRGRPFHRQPLGPLLRIHPHLLPRGASFEGFRVCVLRCAPHQQRPGCNSSASLLAC